MTGIFVCSKIDEHYKLIFRFTEGTVPVLYKSKGVHLSHARLNLEKMLNETNGSIETIDKYENDRSTGTRVVITFNLN